MQCEVTDLMRQGKSLTIRVVCPIDESVPLSTFDDENPGNLVLKRVVVNRHVQVPGHFGQIDRDVICSGLMK